MANTTFNGPVRSEKGFQVATKNTTTGAVTTRYSSQLPDLTGLSLSDVATSSTITLAADTITYVNYTGAAACAATLPAAAAGTVVVYVQTKDTAGGTATLSFDCAGSDVYKTGSIIESRGSSEVSFDSSAANETLLTFTPADAATNLLTTSGKLYFVCYEKGTWVISYDFASAAAAVTGAFAFAS
jgi:hypothetical protein